MRADHPLGGEVRQNADPGSLADVYRVIDSLKGRSLEEELAGLRKARERLLAAVPKAAERARQAERISVQTNLGELDTPVRARAWVPSREWKS